MQLNKIINRKMCLFYYDKIYDVNFLSHEIFICESFLKKFFCTLYVYVNYKFMLDFNYKFIALCNGEVDLQLLNQFYIIGRFQLCHLVNIKLFIELRKKRCIQNSMYTITKISTFKNCCANIKLT